MIKSSQSAKARLATVHLPPTPLTDAQWARIEPLIPDWTPRRGGRWRDHHEAISSISRWIHREKYGNWRGVYEAIAYLVGDSASFVQGALLAVDGGRTAV